MAFGLEKLRLKGLFKFRSGVADSRYNPPTSPRSSSPYHAVSIMTTPGASVVRGTICAAAAACGERRFLAASAPPLPLPDCTVANCRCRYQHHEDRRYSPRRAIDSGVPPSIPWCQAERRGRRGRRATDH